MWKTTIAAAIVLGFAPTSQGEYLHILRNTWHTESGPTCLVTLSVQNDGPEDILLATWQLVCQIVPVGNSPTDAFFTSLPNYAPSNNFVFDDQFLGVFRESDSSSRTSFSAFSINQDGGVFVQPPDTNLLTFGITSPNATGTYNIVLTPPSKSETGSYWLDSNWGTHTFDARPSSESPDVIVATVVFSTVPELPSGFVLLSGAFPLIIWFACRNPLYLPKSLCCRRIRTVRVRTQPLPQSVGTRATRFS